MSKQLHVGNQQFFRQYAPDSELPLESRIFSIEYEQGNRQRGGGDAAMTPDWTSPLDFNISMNNELYFLRSLHLRLPITASFVDEYGNSVRSPEEVSSFALRNRADRAFRKVECNLNGFRSTRIPDDLAWEEYLVTDDEYGLNLPSEGVPLNAVQLTSATQAGRQQVRRIGATPVARSVPTEENPNFAARARMFSESWNYDNARWEGDITIPVQVGPHQPYSSKKSVRTKFVPYIGQEGLRFEWKNYKAEFDYKGTSTKDQMPIAKYLFEQSTRLHQSTRDTPIARQIGETDNFCLWFSDDMAFLIIPHDGALVRGQEPNGIKCHADVCARFPPGSTVEFDQAEFLAKGRVAGANANGFEADWVAQPFKVFRVQDCSLGGVGGMFGDQGNVSASQLVASTSGAGTAAAKYGLYKKQLARQGGGGIAALNATSHTGTINTFTPIAQGAAVPDLTCAQLGRALCERASVVIFTKDSFTMLGKTDHQPAVITTRALAVAFMNQTAANQSFDQTVSPPALFVRRRYKTKTEASATGAGDIPEELYGQTIAVELARAGHQALLGLAYIDAAAAYQVGVAVLNWTSAQGRAPTIVSNTAAVDVVTSTCFLGRFEAKEREFPPSMTIDANGAIVGMTARNLTNSHLTTGNGAFAGRWDTFEVVKCIPFGNGGALNPANGAAGNQSMRTQVSGGMATNMQAYNAVTVGAVRLEEPWSIDANVATVVHIKAETAFQRGLVPHNNNINFATVSPSHALGRVRYVLTTSGQTSACALNALGGRTAAQYQVDVEASSCYAYSTGAGVQKYETRIPSGNVPIKRVQMTWTGQGPHLLCEWAVLKRIEPTYSLYYPQYEAFRDDTLDGVSQQGILTGFDAQGNAVIVPGTTYRYGTFPLPGPFESVKRSITQIRINEVPSLIIIRCELAETDRNRFDWLDIRAYISNIRFKLNERPDLTSNVPDIVGYRWYLENTKTLMTFEEWKSNCLWVISPQQLSVNANTFTESVARVNTIGIEATIRRPKPYKNASMQYRASDFFPSYGSSASGGAVAPAYAGRSVTTPRFQLKVQFQFDNHSLLVNSRREVLLRKNVLKGSGPDGLTRDTASLPKMGGLLAGPSAPTASGYN